jgi:hypothetical protein
MVGAVVHDLLLHEIHYFTIVPMLSHLTQQMFRAMERVEIRVSETGDIES